MFVVCLTEYDERRWCSLLRPELLRGPQPLSPPCSDQLAACRLSLAGRHAADLGSVFTPGLQVLQGEQRAVLQTQRVRGNRLVDGLLEGLLLQLHEDPVGLLPLSLPLLRRLPPAMTACTAWMDGESCPCLGSCLCRQPSRGYLAMDTVCLFVCLKVLIFKTLTPNKLDTMQT